MFTTRRSRQIFCSPDCRLTWVWRTDPRERPTLRVRLEVVSRDNWTCYLCRKSIDRDIAWPHPLSGSIDHVTPRSMGGSSDPANLRATHWQCNQDKGDGLPSWEAA